MKIVNVRPNISDRLSAFAGFDWNRALFFDIETTGLNHRRSHLYLIGALWLSEGAFRLRQWFAEKPGDEQYILQNFLQFSSGFTRLVHYNGTSFDIPYLIHKCAFYGIDTSVLQMEGCDLYTRFRPLKPWLSTENLKLKTMEQAVGLQRQDCYTGNELIELYKKWLQTGDRHLLDAMLLHNCEDITGMVQIQRLFPLLALRNGTLPLSLERYSDEPDSLTLYLIPAERFPLSMNTEKNDIFLSVKRDAVQLRLPKRQDELRLYFPDYRNYFYLPREDRAIHKSVAVYTDPAYRRKAVPDTCYERLTGTFLPQWENNFTPVFRKNRSDQTGYFLFDQKLLEQNEKLSAYAAQTIHYLLKSR